MSKKGKFTEGKTGKERREIEDILELAKVTEPDKFPVFVARDLHKLPPLDFDAVDVSSLLKDKVILKNELLSRSMSPWNNWKRLKGPCDLFYRHVSNSNINFRRGAYLDSGPMELSHVDLASPSKFDAEDHNRTELFS